MEASLPSWPNLVERLLRRVAEAHPGLTSAERKNHWIRRTLEGEDLLAAGAIVEVMASNDLDEMLPEELYGTDGASAYEPGPIANQVANLRRCFGEQLTILTTNYDDLIERALLSHGVAKKDIKSYVTHRILVTMADAAKAAFHAGLLTAIQPQLARVAAPVR